MDSSPKIPPPLEREALQQELTRVRRASLAATEKGDFRAVAQLTLEAARLNRVLSASQIGTDGA